MFRFTIRELILATCIAALAAGWLVDHRPLARKAAQGEQWKERAEGLARQCRAQGWHVEWNEFGIFMQIPPAKAAPLE